MSTLALRSFGARLARQVYKAGYRVLPRLLQPQVRGPLVLLYHNVEDSEDVWTNKFGINVRPRHFEDHIRFLTTHFRVVPFSRLCRAEAAPDEIAITFDDGSASIRAAVLPIIEKFHCPIKVYLTARNLTETNWLNKLCYLLNKLSLAEQLALREAATGIASHHRPGVHDFVHHFDVERTPAAIESFFRRSNPAAIRRLYLTLEEARQLAEHPLVEIGSHTRTHYPLPRLSPEWLHEEVVEGHRELNRLLDNRVQGFAIPFGFNTHRTPEIAAAVGEVDSVLVTAYGGRLDWCPYQGIPEVKRVSVGGNLGSLWYRLSHCS